MRFRKARVQPNGLAQVCFRVGKLVQKLKGDGQVEIWPWRGPVQLNCLLIILDGQGILVLKVITQSEVVIGPRHAWRQLDGMLKMPDRVTVLMAIIVEATKPEWIKRLCLVLRGE